MQFANPPRTNLMQRIARVTRRAGFFALAERLWPRLVVVASVLAIFLTVSWLGLWPLMPYWLRFGLLAVLALGLAVSLAWALRTPKPGNDEALARVEHASGLQGRPLAALQDAPFDSSHAQGQALWQAHQARMVGQVKRLAAGLPAPRTQALDRWALRAPVLLMLVVAFFVAGPQRIARIEQAFAPPAMAPTVPVRIDVWATPPSYTGLPPRTLLAGLGFERLTDPDTLPPGAMIPTGSRLTILLSDPLAIATSLIPTDGSAPLALDGPEDSPGTLETVLTGDSTLVLDARAGQITLPLLITPDQPPSIRFAGDPASTSTGALQLTYEAQDDYAVTSAQAQVEPADERFTDALTLIEPPVIALVLPTGPSGGIVETTRDLSAHPWAGLEVDMTLVARDGAGQEATSQTRTLILPQRTFREPLARALVEQRRLLAVDTRTRVQALTALEGLALGPDVFMQDNLTTYLALTVTTTRLRLADTREALIDVVDMLWQLALQVEDGDLSLAAERLRQAEDNLAQALEDGASDEEIAQMMDELREAFQDYMQALAERLQNGDMAQSALDMPLQTIDPAAMQDLMDQIQELSELGAADAARELLDQLRQQLDALRGAQAMQQPQLSPEQQAQQQAQQQALSEAMQALQAITRDQQRLLDETFPFSLDAQRQEVMPPREFTPPSPETGKPRAGQNTDPGQNSPDGEPRPDPLDGLAQEQQSLEEQLQALMDQLAELGLDPSQLGQAGEAMDGAQRMLERGSATNAVPEQGRALEALRQGAGDIMQQLAQGQGQQGEGEAQGQGPGQSPGSGQGSPRLTFGPGGDGQRGTDPLGRPQRAAQAQDDGSVRIPQESDIQRARDILNEIQRRLGERVRPQQERDYLDRLIDRF